jgi:site-specific DNA recombinase
LKKSSFLEQPVRGLHKPIITESLFETVQAVLSGKRLSTAPKRKYNPLLPLKCFVCCAACGTPLTGGFVTGKNKDNRFGYYWCRQPGCRSVMVRKETLESMFIKHIQHLQPDELTVSEFPKIAAEIWTEVQGDVKATAKKLSAQLEEQKRLKSKLLRAKLRQEISQAD